MDRITRGDWSVDPPDGRAGFIDAENSSSCIGSWMAIIVFGLKFIAEVLADCSALFR